MFSQEPRVSWERPRGGLSTLSDTSRELESHTKDAGFMYIFSESVLYYFPARTAVTP
jgi:hypothetical protein